MKGRQANMIFTVVDSFTIAYTFLCSHGFYKKAMFSVLLLSLVIGLGSSCSFIDRKKGYQIPIQTREEIRRVESDFMTSVMKGDYDKTLEQFNDSMAVLLRAQNLDSVFHSLRYALFEFPYYSQNIHYQSSMFENSMVQAFFDDEEIKAFSLKYASAIKETVVTTAILGDGDTRSVLIIILGKYDDDWKIDYVNIGWLALEGKDAIDWMDEAEYWIEQEDYVMAEYCSRMRDWLFKPAPGLWFYANESELLDRMQRDDRKISYNLRALYHIDEIDTKPQIREFTPLMVDDKIYPAITYYTKLSLFDSISIVNEISKLDLIFAKFYKNMEHDSIFIKILDNPGNREETDNFIITKRKLVKIKY